jgi:hypothetical protein
MSDMEESQMKQCPYCGEDISINAKKCKHCGEWLEEKPQTVNNAVAQPQPQPTAQPQVIVNQYERKSNGVGTAGFILSLICATMSWLPGVNVFFWVLGLLLSFIGLFWKPRGLAIAGFLISIIDIVLIAAVLRTVGSILGGILD